jgi:polyisoprenoid-binding protein YceI
VRLDPSTADCLVFTYKEGLLSAIAHDLQIRVQEFAITLDDIAWHVEARFDATSLRVVGVMRDGVVYPDELREADKRTIEQNIVRDVLQADRHPDVRFTSTVAEARGDELTVGGTLALHGETRSLVVPVRRDSSGWTAEVHLQQPDYGIRPYRAMLGTLRVRADVVVRVAIPVH